MPLREARELFERDYLVAQINRFGGNISKTAACASGLPSKTAHPNRDKASTMPVASIRAWFAGSQKVALNGSIQADEPLWGFRPEHCLLCDPDPQAYALKIDLVEQLGADTLIHGTLDGDASPIIIRQVGIYETSPGQTVHFNIAAGLEYFFNRDGGQRLYPQG